MSIIILLAIMLCIFLLGYCLGWWDFAHKRQVKAAEQKDLEYWNNLFQGQDAPGARKVWDPQRGMWIVTQPRIIYDKPEKAT